MGLFLRRRNQVTKRSAPYIGWVPKDRRYCSRDIPICEGINQSAFFGKPLQLSLPTGIELRNSSLFLTAGICYHAPTRTGPASPIRSHFESIVFCGFLWS